MDVVLKNVSMSNNVIHYYVMPTTYFGWMDGWRLNVCLSNQNQSTPVMYNKYKSLNAVVMEGLDIVRLSFMILVLLSSAF
jgi:hypothetical protein